MEAADEELFPGIFWFLIWSVMNTRVELQRLPWVICVHCIKFSFPDHSRIHCNYNYSRTWKGAQNQPEINDKTFSFFIIAWDLFTTADSDTDTVKCSKVTEFSTSVSVSVSVCVTSLLPGLAVNCASWNSLLPKKLIESSSDGGRT